MASIVTFGMCKKPFFSSTIDPNIKYLVVEGLINSGTDSTIIHLSRTGKIDTYYGNNAIVNGELKATVTVEGDDNKSYPLKETKNGYYVSAGLNLNAGRNYRLRIICANGQVCLSDYEAVKPSPPIDSLGYNFTSDGITIYANSHDAANNTRYYRWEYQEEWQFRTAYDWHYISYAPIISVPNPPTYCYAGDSSSAIVLASTIKQSQDVVYQAPMVAITGASEKLSIRYSILVKQYVLSQKGYDFWTDLKKNTESLGTIFDAQPSNAQGNVECISDASQPVVGYVSVGTVQSKRIFIDKTDLRGLISQPAFLCPLETVLLKDITPSTPPNTLPIIDLLYDGPTLIGFTRTPQICADCTVRGMLKKPSFWK